MGKFLITACVLLIAGFAQAQQTQDLDQDHSGEVLADDEISGLTSEPDPMETSSVTYLVHTSPAGLMDLDVDAGDASPEPCAQDESAQSCSGLGTDR